MTDRVSWVAVLKIDGQEMARAESSKRSAVFNVIMPYLYQYQDEPCQKKFEVVIKKVGKDA